MLQTPKENDPLLPTAHSDLPSPVHPSVSLSIFDRFCRLFTGPPICPPHIDPSPKYNKVGERVWLSDQRSTHTLKELYLTFLCAPIWMWRYRHVARMTGEELLEKAGEMMDPTVIVPTGDLFPETSYDTVSPQTIITRKERYRKLREENEQWALTMAFKSRRERLKLIDRRRKWTADGKILFLIAQREPTKFELVLTFMLLPVYIGWTIRCFRKLMEDSKRNGEETWDVGKLEDTTLIIPTGPSHWLKEEMLDERPTQEDEKKAEEGTDEAGDGEVEEGVVQV